LIPNASPRVQVRARRFRQSGLPTSAKQSTINVTTSAQATNAIRLYEPIRANTLAGKPKNPSADHAVDRYRDQVPLAYAAEQAFSLLAVLASLFHEGLATGYALDVRKGSAFPMRLFEKSARLCLASEA